MAVCELRNMADYGQVLGVLVILIGFMYPASAAHASWLDRVKYIYQLPSNVEQIQKDYEATKQQLEDQKDKLSEAVRQSQEIEDRLLSQNEALKKENEQLQERLKAMEQVALDKDKRNRKLTYMVLRLFRWLFVIFCLDVCFDSSFGGGRSVD